MRYPQGGVLGQWLGGGAPPATALRHFAFHGDLSAADAAALSAWAPGLTSLSLTLARYDLPVVNALR